MEPPERPSTPRPRRVVLRFSPRYYRALRQILRRLPKPMASSTPQRTGVSPSSSPRLPSPPPFTEVQIGPKSPTIGDEGIENQLGDAARMDDGARRRIRPGTKAADMMMGPPLVPLIEIDSPFQLQEYVKALHHYHTFDPQTQTKHPITKETALILAHPPLLDEGDASTAADKGLWLYELCRLLVTQANSLLVAFFADNPPCSAVTCPEMRASEWQYLCAVHDPPKSCCAIDYCCHTLDWAGNVLTSPKYFSSRLSLGGDTAESGTSMRHLTNIFRRVYRIFAHAWFQHRGAFWQVEMSQGLYVFYKTVCDVYQLIPEDNYTVPHEAEQGAESYEDEDKIETPINLITSEMPRHILQKETNGTDETEGSADADATTTVSVGATTRRHKHTPSTGTSVTSIEEGQEDADDAGDDTSTVPPIKESIEEELEPEPEPEQDVEKGIGRLNLAEQQESEIKAPEDPTPLAEQHSDFFEGGAEAGSAGDGDGDGDVEPEAKTEAKEE